MNAMRAGMEEMITILSSINELITDKTTFNATLQEFVDIVSRHKP